MLPNFPHTLKSNIFSFLLFLTDKNVASSSSATDVATIAKGKQLAVETS